MINKLLSLFLSSHDFSEVSYKYLFNIVLYDIVFFIFTTLVLFLVHDICNDLVHRIGGFSWILSMVFIVQDSFNILFKWWCNFYGKKTYSRRSFSQSQEKIESENDNR